MRLEPSEHQIQASFIQWCNLMASRYEGLDKMFAIPNGGFRLKKTAGKLRAEGTKSGVPDLFLPVSKVGYHGLFIEFKRRKGNLSENQRVYAQYLVDAGYAFYVVRSLEAAIVLIRSYYAEKLEHYDC